MELFKSELERIWKRKLTYICFILIPLSIAGASKYYLANNCRHTVNNPEFVSFGNFPFMMFQEMLVTLFNIFALLFVSISVNEEYRNGQIRMILDRGYTFREIYFAKIVSIITTMAVFFITFFITSTVCGYFIAPKLDKVRLFYHSNFVTNSQALLYSIKYYIIGFLTILAIISVFMLFAVKCRTVTGTIGGSIALMLMSFAFSETVIYMSSILGKSLSIKLYLSTITKIQHIGICLLLAENPIESAWIITVLILHIIVFGSVAFKIFTKEDYLF